MKQPELLVLGFPSSQGASTALRELQHLQDEHLIQFDYPVLIEKDNRSRLKIGVDRDYRFPAFMTCSAWGLLAGALFLEPFFGLLVGGLSGLLSGQALNDSHPLGRRLIADVGKRKLEPGQSALLVLVSKLTPDKVFRRLAESHLYVIQTSLSHAQERRLRNMIADGREALGNSKTTPPIRESRFTRPLEVSK
ncbi:MAG TPA: DUF1269 domain-containing protein [Phycisphaerales bacterium]|nr:DUF1269 domain-containing protein [Phycisphaerales bacterium]